MPIRSVMVIAAVSVTIGWLLASTLSPPVASLQALPDRQPRVTTAAEGTPPYAESLRLRQRDAAVVPLLRRNPFSFAERRRAPGETSAVPEEPIALLAPMPAPPPSGPSLALAGIGASADRLTAVVVVGDDVQIVEVGDTIAGYTVAEITERSVTLSAATGARLTLNLP